MSDKSIDIGLVIQSSIIYGPNNPRTGLFNPMLCKEAWVIWTPNEEVLQLGVFMGWVGQVNEFFEPNPYISGWQNYNPK